MALTTLRESWLAGASQNTSGLRQAAALTLWRAIHTSMPVQAMNTSIGCKNPPCLTSRW